MKKKKQNKKNQQQQALQQPVPVQIQQQGFGHFQYQNGTIYEGQWKLIGGVKMKHGQGKIIIGGSSTNIIGRQSYQGTWKQDKMNGYGVYYYTSGAKYQGQWKNNKHYGRVMNNNQGKYEFVDSSLYIGQWQNHNMHGQGKLIQSNGLIWQGQFVHGIYESKMQKKLKIEKMMKKKEKQILQSYIDFFKNFEQSYKKGLDDKKNFKQYLNYFFTNVDQMRLYVSQPFPKFQDRYPQHWLNTIQTLKQSHQPKILRNIVNSTYIDPYRILHQQMVGNGQIVQFSFNKNDRKISLCLCLIHNKMWKIVHYQDSLFPIVQVKMKKKKK